MFRLFRKLFEKPTAQEPGLSAYADNWKDQNPVAVARIHDVPDSPTGVAAAVGEPEAEREYEEFCAGFCFKPDEKFMEFVRANDIRLLQDWLDPKNPEPEPKAFIRLALEMMRQSQNIWEQPCIGIYLQGRWSQGGGPSPNSKEGLSLLAQVLDKPIKLMYEEEPNPADLQVLWFNPHKG